MSVGPVQRIAGANAAPDAVETQPDSGNVESGSNVGTIATIAALGIGAAATIGAFALGHKRIAGGIAAATVGALVLAGCSSQSSQGGGATENTGAPAPTAPPTPSIPMTAWKDLKLTPVDGTWPSSRVDESITGKAAGVAGSPTPVDALPAPERIATIEGTTDNRIAIGKDGKPMWLNNPSKLVFGQVIHPRFEVTDLNSAIVAGTNAFIDQNGENVQRGPLDHYPDVSTSFAVLHSDTDPSGHAIVRIDKGSIGGSVVITDPRVEAIGGNGKLYLPVDAPAAEGVHGRLFEAVGPLNSTKVNSAPIDPVPLPDGMDTNAGTMHMDYDQEEVQTTTEWDWDKNKEVSYANPMGKRRGSVDIPLDLSGVKDGSVPTSKNLGDLITPKNDGAVIVRVGDAGYAAITPKAEGWKLAFLDHPKTPAASAGWTSTVSAEVVGIGLDEHARASVVGIVTGGGFGTAAQLKRADDWAPLP